MILENFYQKSRNAIEDGKNHAPHGWVIPSGQRDMTRVTRMVNLLLLFPQEQALNRKLLWPMIALYVYVLFASFGMVPGSALLNPSDLPGRYHI